MGLSSVFSSNRGRALAGVLAAFTAIASVPGSVLAQGPKSPESQMTRATPPAPSLVANSNTPTVSRTSIPTSTSLIPTTNATYDANHFTQNSKNVAIKIFAGTLVKRESLQNGFGQISRAIGRALEDKGVTGGEIRGYVETLTKPEHAGIAWIEFSVNGETFSTGVEAKAEFQPNEVKYYIPTIAARALCAPVNGNLSPACTNGS